MSVNRVIELFQEIGAWAKRRDSFERHRTEQFMKLEDFRREIKDLIVWLEMHGWGEATGPLEERMATLIERAWEFDHSCQHAAKHPLDEPRYGEKLDQVIDAAEWVTGALEDLADEIPEEAWRGFDDV